MKLLTIAIPVYNTENYIRRCLDSLLIDETINDIEIIAVNDGSKDNSLIILNEYKQKYPETVIVIDKENGGHGSTINAALKAATGKYFRVLDSDDWVDIHDFSIFVNKLKSQDADLILTNYRKEYIYNGFSEFIEWKDLKENVLYDFDNFNLKLLNKEYFVMANSTYKTSVLRDSKLFLLEKTFYVDMQYNIVPISRVKTFTYIDLDIYRYFIGRPDQSMNLQNFVKNRANHEAVVKYLIDYYNKNSQWFSTNKQAYIKQILFYLFNTHYYIYCIYAKNNKKIIYKEIKSFDLYFKKENIELYKMMNKIGKIRYYRKVKFIPIKINSTLFNSLIELFSKLLKRRAD